MNILIDTHAIIWFLNGSERLSTTAFYVISDDRTNKFFNKACVWKIAIKVKMNKLHLGFFFDDLLDKLAENARIVLAKEFHHIQSLITLPLHHRNPFDRMIIAQSIKEDLPIILDNKNFLLYPIKLL